MGKRSDFERHQRDFYPTPLEAVEPLLGHLEPGTVFDEPCCGDMALVRHLSRAGHRCLKAGDLLTGGDALEIQSSAASVFITNPPWRRDVLHPLIEHLTMMLPAWLLVDADWAHTQQSAPYLERCSKIVSIGRIRWIPGTKNTGKDNSAWYRFEKGAAATTFHGRSGGR